MSESEWLVAVLLGGVMGALGQLIRTVVGLKKQYDLAAGDTKAMAANFDVKQFLVSLALGFVAGVLGLFGLWQAGNWHDAHGAVSGQALVDLLGAGYMGTDFIEGFMRRVENPATPQVKPMAVVPVVPIVPGTV